MFKRRMPRLSSYDGGKTIFDPEGALPGVFLKLWFGVGCFRDFRSSSDIFLQVFVGKEPALPVFQSYLVGKLLEICRVLSAPMDFERCRQNR